MRPNNKFPTQAVRFCHRIQRLQVAHCSEVFRVSVTEFVCLYYSALMDISTMGEGYIASCINTHPRYKRLAEKRPGLESDRVDEESREVGDGVPLGLDDRWVGVEDDVTETVREQRAGSQRPHEVHQPDLV